MYIIKNSLWVIFGITIFVCPNPISEFGLCSLAILDWVILPSLQS